jgi:hypothetical protein
MKKDIGETLEGLCIDNGFLTRTPIAQEIIARTDTWDCSKLKSVWTANKIINRVRDSL